MSSVDLDELEQELEDADDDDRTDAKNRTQIRELIRLAREHAEMTRILMIIATPLGPGDTPAHKLAFRVLSKFAEARREAEKKVK